MRKVGIGVLIFVAVVIVALLVVPMFLNVNAYRGRIQSELQSRLGRSITLGEMHLKLLPPRFSVENLSIADDPRFQTNRPFAQATQLEVAVKLLPLIHGDLQVSSLNLQRPYIQLVRNAQGVWNFSTLGHPGPSPSQQPAGRPAPPATRPGNPPSQPSSGPAFQLDNLQIADGQISVTDYQKHASRATYDHIDLTLKDFAPDKPFSVDAAAHLPGAGAQTLNLKGTGGPLNSANAMATPFDGNVDLKQVSLSGIQKFLNSPALAGTDAVISGNVKLKSQSGKMSSEGNLSLNNVRLHGTDLSYPVTSDFSIADDLNNDFLQISKCALKLGSTPLSINGTVNSKPTPADVNLQLQASNVSISEVARLAAAMGTAFNPGTDIKGQLTANIHAQGAADKPALNGSLSARNVQVSGKEVPEPVSVNAIDLALTPTDVRSNNFTATAGATSVSSQFALAQYTSPSPRIDANLRTVNAKIPDLLNIAKAYGMTSLSDVSGNGAITLDVHAVGPLKNSAAMTFSGNGQLQNASIKTATMAQPLNVRGATMQFTQNSVVLQNLAATLGQTDLAGTLTLRDFNNPQVQFNLTSNRVNVTELQEIMNGAPAAPPRKKAELLRSILPEAEAAAPPAPGMLSKMSGSGTLAVGTILADQLVLNNTHATAKITQGLIQLNPVTAQLYGGQQTGAITVDARRTPMPITVSSKLANVDANKLLSSVSSVKQTLYGLLAANAQTSFAAVSSNDIARTLNGTASLDLTKGRLAGIDMLHQLSNLAKFVNGAPSKNYTDIARLTGNFNIQNGVAQTNNLQAQIEGGSLGAIGAVNLADQSLNMHLTAVLSSAFSKEVGGTGIGGFMNTALANNRGELVIPVILTGTFQRPIFAPDVQKIAQMKLQNLLPNTQNPAGAASGLLGSLLGQKAGQKPAPAAPGTAAPSTASQPQNQQTPANALGGLLNQIIQQKQQKKQQPPK